MNMQVPQNDTKKLRGMMDNLEIQLRGLEAQGQSLEHGTIIAIIKSKIPTPVMSHIEEKKGQEKEWTTALLRKYLNEHVSAREISERTNVGKDHDRKSGLKPNFSQALPQNHRTAEALLVNNETNTRVRPCIFCGGQHYNSDCDKYKTAEERKKKINGCCFICFKKNHKATECMTKKRCYYCKKSNHHSSLCPEEFKVPDSESGELSACSPCLLAAKETVVMQTAYASMVNPVNLKGTHGRILMDSGSYRSYITKKMADTLKLDQSETEVLHLSTFGTKKTKAMNVPKCKLKLYLLNQETIEIEVNVVPEITGSIERSPVNIEEIKKRWEDIQLADVPPSTREVATIDMLIGNDYYNELIGTKKRKLQNGLFLVESKFGWILTGRSTTDGNTSAETMCGMLILPSYRHNNYDLQFQNETSSMDPGNIDDFWKLETIGIKDPIHVNDDDKAQIQFNQTIKKINGRYSVTWPWKEPETESDLPENYALALGRFKSTVRRFEKDNDLMSKENDIIADQERKGIIERVTPATEEGPRLHYIPHHAVVTPTKTTTKVRIVYDASDRVKKTDKSLNDCLHRGPVYLQDLCGLLMRFRLNKVAVVADIEKAFLQVELQPHERDVTRFFWLKDPTKAQVDGNLQIFRFCRVPFGVVSSPFLLGATIQHHLESYENNRQLKG